MSEQALLNRDIVIDAILPDKRVAEQINKVREAILQQANQNRPAADTKPIQ